MLMNFRSLPFSSLICVASAGNVWSISFSSAGRFVAVESNCFLPSVWRVNAVGKTILMDKSVSCCGELRFMCCGFTLAFERAQIFGEIGEARTDGARIEVIVAACKSIGRLQAVACNHRDGGLTMRDATVRIEARRDRCGDAAGSLRKDALCLRELLHAAHLLDIAYMFGPAAVLANHLRRCRAVGRIADGQRTRDGVGPL